MLTKSFATGLCGSASLLWLGSAWAAPPADPFSIWTLQDEDAYVRTRSFAWYVFCGVDGQAVAYDLLLQSNPFRSGPRVDPVWDVGEA